MPDTVIAQQLRLAHSLLGASADTSSLRAVLTAMTELLDADVAALSIGRPGRRLRCLLTVDRSGALPDGAPAALEPYELLAPLRDAALQHPAGTLYSHRELMGAGAGGVSDYFQAWLQISSVSEGCAGYFHLAEGELCKLGFGRLSAGSRAGPFEPQRLAALGDALPLVQTRLKALRDAEVTQALCASFADRYDRYRVGALVIDQDGWVLYQNQTARTVLEQGDGLSVSGSRLRIDDTGELSALMNGICEHMRSPAANGSFLARLFTVSRREASALVLAVSVYREREHIDAGMAVLLIFDPDRPPLERRAAMQRVYALSDREADIVAAISEGMSLEDFAARNGCSVAAARSMLKRVFRKTGTTRQTEVVKLMLSGPAAMVN